jgi:subfamily B ATP-binding cassette protein MsbA
MKKKSFLSQWPPYRGWIAFRSFSRKVGVNPLAFLAPSLLAFLMSLAEGVSIGLLIPTLQGLIDKSFDFVHERPILSQLVSVLPGDLSRNNAAIFILLMTLIFVFALAQHVLTYFATVLTLLQVRELANKIRKLIYGRYLSFGKMFFDRANGGHLFQVLIGYTQQIAQELQVLQSVLSQFFSLLIYSVMAACISWKLALFSGILFPILHFFGKALIRKIKHSSEAYAVAYSEMGAKISNALSAITLVKAYSNEEKEKQWFNFTSERVRDLQLSIDKKQAVFLPFQEIMGLFILLVLLAGMALLLVYDKSANLASFMVFFVVMRRASHGFGVFARAQSAFAGIRGPVQEIRTILSDQDKFFVPEGDTIFIGLKDKIECKNLYFSYKQDRPILDKLNFFIKKGETVAIVGSSGSGKTTLINLLMRFYDVSPGMLFIDGIDIRNFTSKSLRKKIALVSQDTFLLNATFKANVIYGMDREVPAEELQNVLDRSRLLPIVKLIGLDAKIGERGVKLSGGERQRLSIARAMLKDPEIFILDEATSALDSATEGLIHGALDKIVTGKTVIVIAHRLATIRKADRIIVLEKGKIVEAGSFQDLLTNKEGHFYFYWKNQELSGEK